MQSNLLTIKEAAKKLDVSIQTLRRWDASGKLISFRRPGGHRYYDISEVEKFILSRNVKKENLFFLAQKWAFSKEPQDLEKIFHYPNSAIFQIQIMKLEKELMDKDEFESNFSFITSIAGEIGNNSFDHNIGNWPDVPGIFFAYDLKKREIILADRGQGILKTLSRVCPNLKNDEEALRVAFTKVVSGRAPEKRGNGLKFVRNIIVKNDMSLFFQSGGAEVEIKKGDQQINIRKSGNYLRGCIALLKF